MILSTKLLRKADPLAAEQMGWTCCLCDNPASYYDAGQTGGELALYCGGHALLEDLDPDDAGNKGTLQGYPVSRTMPFPDCMDIADLLTKVPAKAGSKRLGTQMWASTNPLNDLQLWDVGLKPEAEKWLREHSIYGSDADLDKNHYVEITCQTRGGVNVALIRIKFQYIIGGKYLAMVPWNTVEAFFGVGQ